MRRGVQVSAKPSRDFDETNQSHQLRNDSGAPINTKKLRKIKDIESEIRCHSARNHLRESGDQHNTARTRSISPASHVPPVEGDFPLEKFYKIYSKIVVQLDAVKNYAEARTIETENLIDLRRQLQRADEFSIRFSRNNLYETKRLINEIKLLIVPYPFETLSPGNCKILCKKILFAFQAASQSLQTYINYAKNPSNLEVPDKINELVLLIADLFLCCEHVSIPANDVYIRTDAVKVCNELMALMKSKLPVCEYVEFKEMDLAKKRTKTVKDDSQKIKKFSMYKPKTAPKLKLEGPKKKFGITCLLAAKAKKSKKDEKKAKITHEIYTQKLNSWQGMGLKSKIVKFKPENEEKKESTAEKNPLLRRPKYVTPREVKCRDDDVETMVQNIGDDEISPSKIASTPRAIDKDENNFRELLLKAIEGLENTDKKEQKMTLKKLLNSIENCSKTQNVTPNSPKVKIFHVLSKDLLEERQNKKKEQEDAKEKQATDLGVAEEEKQTSSNEVLVEEPRLKLIFKSVHATDAPGKMSSRGKIKLNLSEEAMSNASKYRKAFAEFRRNNIMYKETLANKPWELVGKVSDFIILDIIKEISRDFQNDAILRRLYLSELQEVTS